MEDGRGTIVTHQALDAPPEELEDLVAARCGCRVDIPFDPHGLGRRRDAEVCDPPYQGNMLPSSSINISHTKGILADRPSGSTVGDPPTRQCT